MSKQSLISNAHFEKLEGNEANVLCSMVSLAADFTSFHCIAFLSPFTLFEYSAAGNVVDEVPALTVLRLNYI